MQVNETYFKFTFVVEPERSEIFIAELAEMGFDSFEEQEVQLLAYCPKAVFNEEFFEEFLQKYSISSETFLKEEVGWQNWNQLWESNYDPVVLIDKIYIHAHFHPKKDYLYSIQVTPKMSFGTGHHSTTSLMMEMMIEQDFKNKKVLDAGTGTGILAIFAEMLGAKQVFAYDIDDWPVENAIENIELNNCTNIEVKKGVIHDFGFENQFDIVLANINRNILAAELPDYAKAMNSGSTLLLSGFYAEDIDFLLNISKNHYLSLTKYNLKNNWAVLVLNKSN
ncbi:MAG: 50S ribosomal protein L11 methyltransferase [Cytophagales bacterium]